MSPIQELRKVPISKFKAECSKFVDKVQRTGRPLLITRRGVPVVKLIPVSDHRQRFILGDMIGTAEIVGDIVSPVIGL
jgi:prevent-host-death family protein